MIIGEWQAGDHINTDTTTLATDTLGGHRLILLTGSRETATPALTSEGAGIYDLTADGAKIFLNAVKYMISPGGSTNTPPALSITKTQTGVSITFEGTLQSSDSVTGGWVDETTATSPFPVNTTGAMKFYRAKR